MHSGENPDEVPVADAVEQRQQTVPEPDALSQENPPIETSTPDWQEQHQEVTDVDDDGRDDYPQ